MLLCVVSQAYSSQLDIAVALHLSYLQAFLNHVSSVWKIARKEFTHYQLNWIVHRQAHTGEFLKPSADRHNNVAPHKSINVPSCKIFVSPKICNNKWHAVRKSGWLSRINRLNWQFEFIQVRLFAVQILILSIRIHLHRLNIHAMVLFRDFRYYRLRTDLSDALSIYHSSLNHRFPHYLAI